METNVIDSNVDICKLFPGLPTLKLAKLFDVFSYASL